ncbi:hypothetical protein MSAN_00881200 [Mycena sanguinolenta]|uniref:Uncharacterized protein n=1 Tax=Mycena sanguinolenta TaxID=230812 RepID=A0A8H6YW18_9AGAR|nr:hypothetical protein MSAN_00881200 [Mycena sanguinolenta]
MAEPTTSDLPTSTTEGAETAQETTVRHLLLFKIYFLLKEMPTTQTLAKETTPPPPQKSKHASRRKKRANNADAAETADPKSAAAITSDGEPDPDAAETAQAKPRRTRRKADPKSAAAITSDGEPDPDAAETAQAKPRRTRRKADPKSAAAITSDGEPDPDAAETIQAKPRRLRRKAAAATTSDGEPDLDADAKADEAKLRRENKKQKEKEALEPKEKPDETDHLSPYHLGYALLSVGLDKAGADCPKLIPGPLQRAKNTTQHAIAITIDPAFIDPTTVTTDPTAVLKPLGFTAAACNGEMRLQAGTHRVEAARFCFRDPIAVYQRLAKAAEKAGEKGLQREDAEKLKAAEGRLRREAVWAVAIYTQKVDAELEKYYTLMLYLNTNNHLPSLPDRDEDKFNTLVRALGHSSTETAVHIRKWAVDQADSNVQRLVNRFPDVIEWFTKLHEIAAFLREKASNPPTLSTSRKPAGAFPLLCPEFLDCLRAELQSIEPLLQLVSSWFVPGVTDAAKGRIRLLSEREDPILSDTEQIPLSLAYFLCSDSSTWAEQTPEQIAAIVPDGEHRSRERQLEEVWLEIITLVFGLRGCGLASIFPGLSCKVWPALKDLPDAVEESHEWADDVVKKLDSNDETFKKYWNAMGSWAKKCPGARQDANLRLIQSCPAQTAKAFPAPFLHFLESTYVNWMSTATGLKNYKGVEKRFLETMIYELFVTATSHQPLLDSEVGLFQLRNRLQKMVRTIPGHEHFEWWYEGGVYHGNVPSQLESLGDEFIRAAGLRSEHHKRVKRIGRTVQLFLKTMGNADHLGVPLNKRKPGGQA